MANKKIAGLTVKIGADTTELGQALQDVDKKSRELKSELKDIDKALKLDPKNVELLAQKQQVLAEAVENSKKKLDTLKQAQESIEKQFANGEIDDGQYRAFMREVEKAKQELQYYENESEQAKNATKDLGKQVSNVKGDFKDTGEEVEKTGDKVSAFGDSLTDAGKKATAASAVIAAAAAASYKAWEETDEGYDNIIKKTGATGEEFEALKAVADDIFTSMPVDMGKVSNAVAEVNTRFKSTGEQLDSLSTKFLKYSEVNDADVVTSVDNISGALKAFGLGVDDAEGVLDKLTSISQQTGINVSTLESSLLSNAATFKEMGLTIGEAAELLGQFEANGVDTNTAISSITKSFQNLSSAEEASNTALENQKKELDKVEANYSKVANKIAVLKQKQKEYNDKTKESQKLQDKQTLAEYEKELASLAAERDNLTESINNYNATEQDLSKTLYSQIDAIKNAETETEALEIATELFGKKGALQMAQAIRENRIALGDLQGELSDTANTVDTTFEATLDAPDELKVSLNQVKLQASELAAVAMEVVAPALKKLTEYIKTLTARFNSLSDSEKKTIVKIAGVVAAIGPLLIVIGKLTKGIGGVISTVTKLSALLATNPAGAAVIGIMAVVAALAVLYAKNEEFRNFVNAEAKEIAQFFQEISKEMQQWYSDNKPLIDDIITVIKFLSEVVLQYLMMTVKDTVNGFKLAWTAIKATWDNCTAFFKMIVDDIKAIFSVVEAVLTGDFSGAWEGIKRIFSNSKEFFGTVWNNISGVFEGVGEFFGEKFKNAWKAITNVFDDADEYFGNIWTKISNTFAEIGTKTGEIIGAAFTTAINGALEIIEGALNAIPKAINGAIDLINKLPKVDISPIPEITLPRLAKGGKLYDGSAIVAEAGPELITMMGGKAVVTPLSNNANNTPVETGTTNNNKVVYYQTYNVNVKSFATPEDAQNTAEELARLEKQINLGKGKGVPA